jgi:hypothetical protein
LNPSLYEQSHLETDRPFTTVSAILQRKAFRDRLFLAADRGSRLCRKRSHGFAGGYLLGPLRGYFAILATLGSQKISKWDAAANRRQIFGWKTAICGGLARPSVIL